MSLAWGRIEQDRGGYAPKSALVDTYLGGRASRSWWLGSRLVSLQIAGTRHIYKACERFPVPNPPALLTALAAVGVDHPASLGDCYHQIAPAVTVPATYNGMLRWWPGGPWEEARQEGYLRGPWYRYDVRSAYRWAATLTLPDPATYRIVKGAPDAPYIAIGDLEPRSDLPPSHRHGGRVVVTHEEAATWGLSRAEWRPWRAITWDRDLGPSYVENTLRRLPCPKEAGRAYWGLWAGRDPLRCCTAKDPDGRILKNRAQHLVWAWLIVSRVRLAVWHVAARAAHVYVDEVVVPEPLPESPGLGGWHLKESYPNGVIVHRTGWYGGIGQPDAMQTGVAA